MLLVFGSDWCEDCRVLDASLKNTKTAALISSDFLVVKIDIGHFDENLELCTLYGNPTKNGIPAVVIISPTNQILFATYDGELSSAKSMSEKSIHEFFLSAVSALR